MFRFNRQLLSGLKNHSNNSLVKYAALSLGSLGLLYGTKMANAGAVEHKTIFDFEVKDIDENLVSLSKYRGYVTLIVNVASK